MSFKLKPVGVFVKEEGRSYIQLYPEYKRGLKNIVFFTSLRVLWFSEEKKELSFGSPVSFGTFRVSSLDLENSIIEVSGDSLSSGSSILDIKAYIPVEDRVKDFCVPEKFRSMGEWYDSSAWVSEGGSIEKGDTVEIKPIGTLKSEGRFCRVELNGSQYSLKEKLKGFSHINLLWYFHRFDKEHFRKMLVCKPPYKGPESGVFASRSPVRPNPLALTVAGIEKLEDEYMIVSGIDAYNNTPLLDIRPYIPCMDRVRVYTAPAWMEHWPEWLQEGSRESEGVPDMRPSDSELVFGVDKNEAGDLPESDTFEGSAELRESDDNIRLTGARQNNLCNVDLEIKKNSLTVITGVSGSGKSSIAFDTLYAEGQRRYLGSMMGSMGNLPEKPDFDHIENLPPVVAVNQRAISGNLRSTVGSFSDIYSFLRLFYSGIGKRHCVSCGRRILEQSVHMLAENLMTLIQEKEVKLYSGKKRDGEAVQLKPEMGIGDLNTVAERLYRDGKGTITILTGGTEYLVSRETCCPYCDNLLFKLTPSAFSYNSPQGMCSECYGLGRIVAVDENKLVNRPDLSLLDGASPFLGNLRKFREKPNANWMRGSILALAEAFKTDLETPWNELPEDFKKRVLYGCGDEEYSYSYKSGKTGRSGNIKRPVAGIFNEVKRLLDNSKGGSGNGFIDYTTELPCSSCKGERLGEEGRLTTVSGMRYPEVAAMSVDKALHWIKTAPLRLNSEERALTSEIRSEIESRLISLKELGLYYMTLDRSLSTVSGGEGQRIKLARQIGCGLSGLLYILDEPSAGLHPSDHKKVINLLKDLKESGNTVLVVEHDEETIGSADEIIDIGPGAGKNGGRIVARGTPDELAADPDSITGPWLRKDMNVYSRSRRELCDEFISLEGADIHNLQDVDISFPLRSFISVTGVSGSGKTSLILKTLVPAILQRLKGGGGTEGGFKELVIKGEPDKLVHVDQSPIGRSSRSTPATYTGVFDEIRRLFASVPEALDKGFEIKHFSYNDKDGQCPECQGLGRKKSEMGFMQDIYLHCSFCDGKRYRREILDIEYGGVNISEILDMSVAEALKMFGDNRKIKPVLETLAYVGLDYLTLGQNAVSLSGGEAQRIKLANELSKSDTGNTIYVLDEPTSGLHFNDIDKLLNILHNLVDRGNTVLVIEHDPDVISSSDWIIDLGPRGGEDGGEVIHCGSYGELLKNSQSYTGMYLKKRNSEQDSRQDS